MRKTIDINCDMGESFGRYILGEDNKILPWVSSVNIACGFHAGDSVVMSRTVKMALEAQVAIGAHPSYPDLSGFGRREMKLSSEELRTCVQYQIAALKGFVDIYGGKLHHVKPHGALYNQGAIDEQLALDLVEAVAQLDENLLFVGLAGSAMERAANQKGLPFAREVFADRAYRKDGTLLPRSFEGSVLHEEDEILRRVMEIVTWGTVDAFEGGKVALTADTICIHGDTARAAIFAQKMFQLFQKTAIEVRAI